MQSSTPSLSYVLPFLLAIFFSFSWSRPVLDSFCFELTRVGVVLTRVDSCRTRVDSCWTRVGLVLICVDSFRTCVDPFWFVLTRVGTRVLGETWSSNGANGVKTCVVLCNSLYRACSEILSYSRATRIR